MKRSPMPRKAARPRRKPAVTCATLRCKRRPGTNAPMCVQHLEAKADRLFSLWVRERDGYCTYIRHSGYGWQLVDRCNVGTGIQAAHIIGRRNKAVRFDPANVHALCPAHHVMVDQHGREHAKYDWAVSLLGESGFAALRERARIPKPRITAALEALEWLEEAG